MAAPRDTWRDKEMSGLVSRKAPEKKREEKVQFWQIGRIEEKGVGGKKVDQK